MNASALNDFFNTLVVGFTELGNWLTRPLFEFIDIKIIPIQLICASGLILFLGYAVTRWFFF